MSRPRRVPATGPLGIGPHGDSFHTYTSGGTETVHRHKAKLLGTSVGPQSITDSVNWELIGFVNLGSFPASLTPAVAWIGIRMDTIIVLGGGSFRIRRSSPVDLVLRTFPFTTSARDQVLDFDLSFASGTYIYRLEGKVNAAGDQVDVNEGIFFVELNLSETAQVG